MPEPATLLGPDAPSSHGSRMSALPRDLLDQVRGRVRLLSLLLLGTFSLGPVLFGVSRLAGALQGERPPTGRSTS